jgi:hypothetical protein
MESSEHVTALGLELRDAIVLKILSNIPPPNAPSTIKAKGSSSTLIDTGHLLASIDVEVVEETEDSMTLNVGVLDPDTAEIAIVHEFGSEDGHIPERSFERSAYDTEIDGIVDRFAEKVGQDFAAKWKG